jgi:glutamate racemase
VLRSATILVFDSGLGGLTVFREVARARPDARFLYVADDAFFPYGDHGETDLIGRVTGLLGDLIEAHRPDIVVIACNTASTLVLLQLRARFSVPFIGTVPAIKPACAASLTKLVSVLGTEATVRREYTHALIRDFSNGSDVTLVGTARLAGFAEAEFNGAPVEDAAIAREIALSNATDGEPTRSCSRAHTIRCCCRGFSALRRGRWRSSIRRLQSPGASSISPGRRGARNAQPPRKSCSRRAGRPRLRLRQRWRDLVSAYDIASRESHQHPHNGSTPMGNGSSTVRRTLQFKFTLPAADVSHLLSMLRAAEPFLQA